MDFVPTSLVMQYVPRISGGFYWGVTEVVSAVKKSGSVRLVLCGLCFPGGGVTVGTDFGWSPRGSLCSADHEMHAFHWRVWLLWLGWWLD